jgi:hypothetical protein
MAKWKKRLRKGLKKAVPLLMAAGLAKSLMGRKGTAAADIDSGRSGDSASAAARVAANAKTPTQWITKKVVADNNAKKAIADNTTKQPVSISRNTGIAVDASGNKVGAKTGSKVPYIRRAADTARLNKIRAFRDADALSMRQKPVVRTVDPITDFDQSQEFGFGVQAKDGGRIGKRSGGRVKGVGKAKRGFGRALKGRK